MRQHHRVRTCLTLAALTVAIAACQRQDAPPAAPTAAAAATAEDAFEFIGYVEKLTNGPLASDLDDGFDYAATVANTYDDYAEPVRAGNWARPLIEIITSAAKNTVRV